MAKLSVIIPLYNKEVSIINTIESVVNQTFSDFEVIIVNDGSTDGSVDSVSKIDDNRIIIVNKPNGGVSSARNVGIKTAKTNLLFFLDGDDTIKPCCLESLYKLYIEHPEADLWCGNYSVIYPNCRVKDYCLSKEKYVIRDNFKDYWKQLYYLRTGVVLVKKDVFDHIGFFDEKINVFEDYEIFLKMIRYCKIAYTPQNIFEYKKEFSSECKGISKNKSAYLINLYGTSGYEKRVFSRVWTEILVAGRNNNEFCKGLVVSNKQYMWYLLLWFIPNMIHIIKNTQIIERFKKSLYRNCFPKYKH